MMLDYQTLLLALGVSATCLAMAVAGSWLERREDGFLLTSAFGLSAIICGISTYGFYLASPNNWLGTAAIALFQTGFAVVWAAAVYFRTGQFRAAPVAAWTAVTTVLSVCPMAAGYDGLAFILANTTIAAFLFATAWQYRLARGQAGTIIDGLTALYALTGSSFLSCAAYLLWDGTFVLGHAPANWAEDLNLMISIGSLTGIGALSLALHQWRLAAGHRRDAITDQLTGLLNRRALFDLYGAGRMSPSTAILVFDIDHFKSINDNFGHAGGDEVLRIFAAILVEHCRAGDTVARLGGEEFALVLKQVMPGRAERVAEAVRDAFENKDLFIEGVQLKSTVSVGVATPSLFLDSFDALLSAADKALYTAKRSGRNRVVLVSHLQAIETAAISTAS